MRKSRNLHLFENALVLVRVFSKNTDFDIFVRYDSGNLSDYRHFSRIWSISKVDGISMCIMALRWAHCENRAC